MAICGTFHRCVSLPHTLTQRGYNAHLSCLAVHAASIFSTTIVHPACLYFKHYPISPAKSAPSGGYTTFSSWPYLRYVESPCRYVLFYKITLGHYSNGFYHYLLPFYLNPTLSPIKRNLSMVCDAFGNRDPLH